MFKAIDETKTLDRLTKAMKRQHPVTVSYVRADGEHVLRTIEIYEIPDKPTKGGKRIVRAMDRDTGQTRSWRIDRIVEYVIHRSHYTIERCPEHNQGTNHCTHLEHVPTPEGYWCDEHQVHSDDCHDWIHRGYQIVFSVA